MNEDSRGNSRESLNSTDSTNLLPPIASGRPSFLGSGRLDSVESMEYLSIADEEDIERQLLSKEIQEKAILVEADSAKVKDCQRALQDLYRFFRREHSIKYV
jgi:hypothetical protein